MRASQTFQIFSIILLYLSAYATAWPIWPKWLPELDSIIVRRQNSNSTTSASPTGTGSSAKATATTNTGKGNGGGGTTTFAIGGSAPTGNSTITKASVTGHTSYDPRLPAGGVSMMTPAVILGEQYYKIGDNITFGWNYTSLLATPTAVNVLASCSANSQIYTVAANQTITNGTQAVTWDTSGYQATAVQQPLLTEHYTLIIYDAATSVTAQAQAGYLAPYSQFVFGMYIPQPYTSLADFQCATCSGAMSDMEKRALGMVLAMCGLTVLSFTWFVSGTGIIW